MLEMASGKPVPEFKPRKQDLMPELFDAFNTLIKQCNARISETEQSRSESPPEIMVDAVQPAPENGHLARGTASRPAAFRRKVSSGPHPHHAP